jgi:hypothetical protein
MSRGPKTPPPNWTPPPGQWPPPDGWHAEQNTAHPGNWFAHHKGLSVIAAFFGVLIVVVSVALGTPKASPTSAGAGTTQHSANATPTQSSTAIATTGGSGSATASGTNPAAPTATAAGTPATRSATTATTATTSNSLSTAAADALAALDTLAVKGRAPMTGYSRDQFGPAWPSIAGCDERNDTLRRDLTAITMRDTCVVASGTLVSPYTGGTISFVRGPNSVDVQIDHVVALGDAWQTGAQYWNTSTRATFADDPIELLAVDAHSNEQKGDSDAASWLPSNKAFRCTYVSQQVDVKAKYHLWVTQAEHDAIANILAACSSRGVQSSGTSTPTKSDVAPPPPAPTTTAAAPKTTLPAPAPTHSYVTPGAFCSTAGATGFSKTGKPEVCKTTATDPRLRWRAA